MPLLLLYIYMLEIYQVIGQMIPKTTICGIVHHAYRSRAHCLMLQIVLFGVISPIPRYTGISSI